MEYAYRDFTLSAEVFFFAVDQFVQNNDAMCGGGGCGTFSSYYDFDVGKIALGYDVPLLRSASGFHLYLPVQAEYTALIINTPEFNPGAGPQECFSCGGSVESWKSGLGVGGGLGMRYYAWRWLVLDASARYYSGALLQLTSPEANKHFILKDASTKKLDELDIDGLSGNSGYDFIFRLGFAIW
jgi:hypothetical protein